MYVCMLVHIHDTGCLSSGRGQVGSHGGGGALQLQGIQLARDLLRKASQQTAKGRRKLFHLLQQVLREMTARQEGQCSGSYGGEFSTLPYLHFRQQGAQVAGHLRAGRAADAPQERAHLLQLT